MFLLLGLLLGAELAADAIVLSDGRVLHGRVTDYDGKQIGVELAGGVKTRLPVERLAPDFRYRLVIDRLPPASAADHLALARFCLSHALAGPARKHLLRARELEPALDQEVALRLAELDEIAAELRYRRILALAAADKPAQALEAIARLRRDHPGAAPARWAEELAPGLRRAVARQQEARRKPAAGRQRKRELALELQRERERQQLRDTAGGSLKQAAERRAEALRAEGEGNESRAIVQFREASVLYEKALEAAQKLRRRVNDRQQMQQALDWQQQIIHRWTLLAIDAAHLRARQGNWKDAHRWLGLAIRLEPLNTDARRLHGKIGERRRNKSLQKLTNAKPIIRSR